MSIVRVSAFGGALHGLWPNGAFVHEPYSRRTRRGRTEMLAEPWAAAGGLDPILTSGIVQSRQDLDRRGMPRANSDLSHLLTRSLRAATEKLGDAPVVVMIHGFLFDPRDSTSETPKDSDNPHSRLYHHQVNDLDGEIRHHTTGWPAGLGFSADDVAGEDGMALAFGWHSRPGFASSLIQKFQNFYARAYDNAEPAAWNLLTTLHVMDQVLPAGKRIDIFCHSLGSRVAIRLLALMVKHGRLDLLGRIDRVLILGGAEFVVEARLMLRRLTDAGFAERIAIYNIVSRENDVLDKLAENFGGRTFGNSNVIGHNGLDVEVPGSLGPGWLDMQVDSWKLQAWMSDRGFKVTGDNPDAVWDHWYYFTDRGNMAVWRSILRDRARWVIPQLRAGDDPIPDGVSRRRSVYGD